MFQRQQFHDGCQTVLLGACFALLTACGTKVPPAPPPPEIAVMEVVKRDTDITQDFVGQTLGSTDIPIRARVEGFLESRNFTEGRPVTKGQLLYTIDPAPYRTKVVEAEGRMAEATTMLAKAEADLARIEPLAKMKAVSEQQLDATVAERDAAQGSLQAAQAQLELANIQLGYARIHSPIDGLIGISAAQVGEFVGAPPNPVVLNKVSLTNPIRVRFSINERDFLRYTREAASQRNSSPTGEETPDKDSPVILLLADGSTHSHTGRIVAGDASMNPATGTYTLEADFPNPDHIVIAGQFARARIVITRHPDALLVPQRAMTELQGIFRLFVIGQDGVASMRTVELGPQVGRMWLVKSGVEAGEQVAVEGLLRLRDGMTVIPKLVKPGAAPADKKAGS